jgi:hypothetical protein
VKGLRIGGLVLLLLFAGGLAAAFIVFVVQGFGRPEPARFSRERAVVESVPSNLEVNVSYRDGVRSTSLELRGSARPESGTRLLLERWNGDIVALYDPVSEHRYRTVDWPVRWSADSFVLPLALALATLICVGTLVRGIVHTARS